jgi:hypothetical protein
VTFTSALLIVAGLILLAQSLRKVDFYFCVLSICLLTPSIASMAFHQKIFARASTINLNHTPETIYWLGETLTFVISVGCLILLHQDSLNDPAKPVDMFYLMPITSSIQIGVGLGLYKKICHSEVRASPKFPVSFIFFVTFAMVVVSPIFKFPSIAHQVQELAD